MHSTSSNSSVSGITQWIFSTPLSDRELTTQTLWQQRHKTRQFPVTLLFNILLLTLCTIQCLLITLEYTDYNRGNENGFRNLFHPEEYREGIYSIGDVMQLLEDLTEQVSTQLNSTQRLHWI
jgi:hypothetical protein